MPRGVRLGLRKRVLATVAAAAALCAVGLALAAPKPPAPALGPKPVEVTATPLASFDKVHRDRTGFGRLEWRGGLVLTSTSRDFGGWSGLALGGDGRTFFAVSDAGAWITGRLDYAGSRLAGMTAASAAALTTLAGGAVKRVVDRDAEAVAALEGSLDSGKLYIAFERNHRIGVFDLVRDRLSPPRRYLALPPESRRMSRNRGLEALAVLQAGPRKGAVVAFSERLLDRQGRHSGWIWVTDKPRAIKLTNPGEYDVTDAAGLPDGSLLVLERRFGWLEGIRMRLRLIPAAAIREGAVLEGEILIEADQGQEIDNMEGLAVHRSREGETVLTLISDDNFNAALQRTVLLQFTLRPE